MGCVWKVAEEDRRCGYCLYRACKSRSRPRKSAKEVCDGYVSVMNGLCGINVTAATRKREAVWGRNMIAMQMLLDGFVQEDIGASLGKNRSSIVHCIDSVTNMLDTPDQYPVEYGVWQKFREIISNSNQ